MPAYSIWRRLGLFALAVIAVSTAAVAQQQVRLGGPGTPGGQRAAAKDMFASPDAIARWINGYRKKPQPNLLPQAVSAMVGFGIFKDADSSGLYLGFMAGVLGANPKLAPDLVAKMFPMPPEDHPAIIKAIAYSGLPDWKQLLSRNAERMPARAVLVDRYLTGKLPALDGLVLDAGPAPLDIMWGYWFATGSYDPIVRIVSILKWSKDQNNVERLTIGSMAKWTLATNASRDMDLLQLLKGTTRHEAPDTRAILNEVIEAADTAETGKIRKEALTAIETLKVKGPESSRRFSWWGQAGQTALALGCIVAGAMGHVEVGIPCVVGGAVSGAALKMLSPQP
ncbi:MAG: hypothetical protein KGP27_12260 [Hyphomicrobiales bacterium]|nr:hypothetical protein [Hyphomicrobiales bacterium]